MPLLLQSANRVSDMCACASLCCAFSSAFACYFRCVCACVFRVKLCLLCPMNCLLALMLALTAACTRSPSLFPRLFFTHPCFVQYHLGGDQYFNNRLPPLLGLEKREQGRADKPRWCAVPRTSVFANRVSKKKKDARSLHTIGFCLDINKQPKAKTIVIL